MCEPTIFWNGTVSAVIGAVAGGFIGYFSAILTNRRQQFNIAAGKFRAAFVETKRLLDENRLYDLSTQYDDPVFDILKAHIIHHERAKIRFSAFVSKNNLKAFGKAWDTYYGKSQDRADYPLTDYACDRCSKTNKIIDASMKEKRQQALDRIDRLLEFAKRK